MARRERSGLWKRALSGADPSARQENRSPRHASRFVRASRLDPAMPAAQQIVLFLAQVAPELFFFSLSGEGSREGERLCCATLRFLRVTSRLFPVTSRLLRVTLRLFPLREPQSQADEPRCELISPRSEALKSLVGSHQPHVALMLSPCGPDSPRRDAAPSRSDVHEPRSDASQPRCDATALRSGYSQPRGGPSSRQCGSASRRCGSASRRFRNAQSRSGSSEPRSDAKKPQRDASLPELDLAQPQDGPSRRWRRVLRQQRQEPAPPGEAISSPPHVSVPQSLGRLP